MSVAEAIQRFKRAHARVEHAFAALAVDVFFEIARHRRDHFDLLGSQELCEIFLTRLLEDGQIAAVHHVHIELACCSYQITKMHIEFGRTAGQIEFGNAGGARKLEHFVHGFA